VHARTLWPLLARDEQVDLPEMGARLLVAVLLAEHGELGAFVDVRAMAIELKQRCPMVWGAIRKGTYMAMPKLLKMHGRRFSLAREYQTLMQKLQPPDPPGRPLARPDSRESRTLPPDVVERVAMAREQRQG
jgi:hypothetical protein